MTAGSPVSSSPRPKTAPTSRIHGVLLLLFAAVLMLLLCAPRTTAGTCDIVYAGDAVADASIRAVHAGTTPSGVHGPLRLVINLPGYRLDVFQNDSNTDSYTIAVGSIRFPSPRGSFTITEIEWNPWWIPPPSDWAKRDTVTPPGPTNPMGRVKLYFRPAYFVHGTPQVQSLGSAASHGCLRMANEDAIELARVVQRYGAPHVTDATVDSVLARHDRTHCVVLATPVPIELRYALAEVRGDSVFVHRDIYRLSRGARLDETVAAAAAALGIDSSEVRKQPLRNALRISVRRTAAVALADLR
jgi:murein L,D-transpeptidase YcbB/YkuD